MDPFVGEIRCFGFTFAPVGWALCQGQLLSISSNTALYSLLGTQYGGDGRATFGLPDLQGRVPVGQGQGQGLSPRAVGAKGGAETVTLTSGQLPAHQHSVAASSGATGKSPAGTIPAYTANGSTYGTTADLAMSPTMVGGAGGGQSHDNLPPYLVLNWCIALQGIYPARN